MLYQNILKSTELRMGDMFTANQVLGRLQSIGCVAVEITQKCNLDCTLCYLSESSQAVKDIPIEEVFNRLDQVVEHYGRGTHVQITGGDPTLRKHTELIEIVKYASNLGLYTALFTNGIAASRSLLKKLANAGLHDVAFHVDTTQRRKEGSTEASLNDLRLEYINRAKGLGLMVIFNTTVHTDNFSQIPELVRFFKKHAKDVGLVSFQLQADTGRGELGARDVVISQQTVRQQVESGTTPSLPWDAIQVGHSDCHNYLPTLVINDTVYPMVPNKQFFAEFVGDFSSFKWDRIASRGVVIRNFLMVLITKPKWWFKLIRYGSSQLLKIGPDLIRARGKAYKLTFFIQNFMDAKQLVEERIGACSFMVMTADGPVSMCQHNARRDEFILKPLEIKRANGTTLHYKPLKTKRTVKPQANQQTDQLTAMQNGL